MSNSGKDVEEGVGDGLQCKTSSLFSICAYFASAQSSRFHLLRYPATVFRIHRTVSIFAKC